MTGKFYAEFSNAATTTWNAADQSVFIALPGYDFSGKSTRGKFYAEFVMTVVPNSIGTSPAP